MALSERERAVAAVAGAIAAFAARPPGGEPASMYEFVLRCAPEGVKPMIDAALIDEVFEYAASGGGA
ncbi:MAG: hypothetical protein MPI95_00440 [Nitrosopumilus sp.]|nr:hypothetical protein [Nitrosopumilus sp.]MDA7943194.1 hypothetical protein [Nitrosopumilus sp.]MDA7952411.1 hypothetical protein [Nitrosopumilus sp.]MDA7957549.1 hypothetical protein [Nitrosopumilus sp.]MDA7959589.1 hypothetical protein [Nitrosopumilus sp.]